MAYQWEWKDGNIWRPYADFLSSQIEYSYKNNFQSIEFDINGQLYEISFANRSKIRQVLKSNYKKWRWVRRREMSIIVQGMFSMKFFLLKK